MFCVERLSLSQSRVLVTHGLTYLPRCDRVVVMSDGRISEVGTYEDLLNSQGSFADFVRKYLEEEASDPSDGEAS